jgi:hypothetical protein
MANRFINSVENFKKSYKNADKTPEKIASDSKTLDMDTNEHFRFQELKSLAQIHGVITLDEAQYIYTNLGETVSTFNSQPIWVKACLTTVFKTLLKMKIERKF